MDTKETQALSIYEIVLAIGKAIPLWVPEYIKGETVWNFHPKDLIATIKVNRLFHTILTPILWTAYANPCDRSRRRSLGYYTGHGLSQRIRTSIIEKNSKHFRYVDLSLAAFIDSPLRVERLRLSCTRLQELRISSIADAACVAKLLEMNPDLRLLYWRRSSVIACSPSELKVLFPLRQLRSLLLDAWTLDPVYLHQVLSNNADTLEELELGLHCQYKFIFEDTPMNTHWSGQKMSTTSSMTEEQQQYVETAQMVQGLTLLLPKLKSLRLELSWHGASDTAFSLVRSFPALETITLGFLEMEFSSRLAKNLREGCPNLRSIKNPDVHLENRSLALIGDDVAACLVDACAPGNMVHAVLKCGRFENELSDSLLVHRDRLEVLELGVYHQTTTEALENIRKVVERCKRLKRFSVYNYSRAYKAQDASILLAGVKECLELEHLVLAGFPFIDITSKNAQNEKVRTKQYLAEIKNEVRAYVAVLPPGWRYSARGVAGSSEAAAVKALWDMTYEAVCHLSGIKTIVLNRDGFDIEHCSSSQ